MFDYLIKYPKYGPYIVKIVWKSSINPIWYLILLFVLWEQCKLSDITEVIMGQSPSSKNYTDNPNDDILVQGNADLKDGKVVPRLWTKEITKTIDKGGIILTVRAPVGDVAKTDYKVVLGRGVAGIKGNDYIYQFLQKLQYNRYWVSLSSGSTFESINSNDIKDLIIDIPSIEEQTKISMLLNNVNSIITLHQRKLEKLKLAKKALLQKLFPKNGSKFPELRFKGFADAWEQRKLGDIATFSKGNGYSKSDLGSSGDPIILYGRLYTNYETTISNVDTFVELKDKSIISQGGEVIVPASGETAEDISRASVVKNQGIIIGGDLNVIKANYLLDPTFLALTISNGEQQKELSKRAQGKSVVHLHNSDLQEVNLTFPLLNEQKEISTLFEKMDNIITLHQQEPFLCENSVNDGVELC